VKLFQEICQRYLLFWRSRILGRLTILGTSSDIDNTDAISVVSILGAMGAHLVDVAAIVDRAIEVYHFVITDAAPFVLASVDVINLLDCHLATFG
jgi:hypothetical protein